MQTSHTTPMHDDIDDFVRSLATYVAEALRSAEEAPEYNAQALRICDARNHIFAEAGRSETDEEQGVYALRDLCKIDEDTLDVIPDVERLRRVARNFFY